MKLRDTVATIQTMRERVAKFFLFEQAKRTATTIADQRKDFDQGKDYFRCSLILPHCPLGGGANTWELLSTHLFTPIQKRIVSGCAITWVVPMQGAIMNRIFPDDQRLYCVVPDDVIETVADVSFGSFLSVEIDILGSRPNGNWGWVCAVLGMRPAK